MCYLFSHRTEKTGTGTEAPLPELVWKTAEGAPESHPDFDDSDWKVISATSTANYRQGPGSNQGVVLDSNCHHFFEDDVWYRSSYTASAADGTISLQGNGGTAANMLVWTNGVFLGAPDANGSWKDLSVLAGTFSAGDQVTLSVLVRNQGQNLDWSDNGLSKQNRGLYDARLNSEGEVT